MWDQGRSMDKMSSQTSFPLKHSMILWWSMDCPLPINIQLNSSPVYILGDSEECGCSFCLLQLIVSRLCPGDAIRELTGMGNRLLLTERNSQTTSPTFLSDSCHQPPPPHTHTHQCSADQWAGNPATSGTIAAGIRYLFWYPGLTSSNPQPWITPWPVP